MIKHTDEILLPVLDTDTTAIPRYNIVAPDGQTIHENVALKLANSVAQPGTPVNKPLLDEFLAASGTTAGTATAYTLAQDEFSLFNGAVVRFQLHTASGGNATLNINGTGAKPLRDTTGSPIQSGIPAGTWLTAIYSAPTGAYIFAAGSGGGSNVNLIDNWYLADPVNSRGLTEYASGGYSIDRWIATVSISDGEGIKSIYDNSAANQKLNEKIKAAIDGKVCTATVICNGMMDTVTFSYKASPTDSILLLFGNKTNIYLMYDGSIRFDFRAAGDIMLAVKLELGDKQTLARQDADGNWILNDPPPDKGLELLKCIQSTADPDDTYANKVVYHTGNKPTAEDIGALPIKNLYYAGNIDVITEGAYIVLTGTGDIPFTHTWYDLIAIPSGTGGISQIAMCSSVTGTPTQFKFRHHNGEGWSSWSEAATIDYVNSAGGTAKLLSNTRITSDAASLSISLPSDYTYFRIIMTEVATTDPSTGNVRGAFDVDSANMSNSGMQISGSSDGTATATAVSMSNAAFLVTLANADTFGAVVLDIVRYSGITQGTCRWSTDGGGESSLVSMGSTNFSAVGTPTGMTITAMGGFALRQGMAIMVMGVK